MAGPTEELDCFKARYSLERSRREADLDERVEVSGEKFLSRTPASSVLLGYPPGGRSEGNRGVNRYLWVIDLRGIVYILEAMEDESGRTVLKHTNLTMGGLAYMGGEMWFKTESSLWVSGGSGRYPPVSEVQLEDAVKVFRSYGYGVESLGWGPSGANRFLEEV